MKQLNTSFAEALHTYHRQNWPVACEQFENILTIYPQDGPSKFYLGRSLANLRESARYNDPSLILMDEK
jgi:hypothetical protein